MINFERILHPAGCGAFATERFVCEDSNRVFNVVYDCGTLSKGHKAYLETEAEMYLGDQTIDFLFISHLDQDHINVLTSKLKQSIVPGKTKIFLPFFEPKYQSLKNFDDSIKAYYYLREDLFDGCQIIYVSPANGENRNNNESITYNVFSDQNKELPHQMPSGTPIRLGISTTIPAAEEHHYRIFWEYIPFNLRDNSLIEAFFKGIMDDADISDQEKEILQQGDIPQNWDVETIKQKLKKHYQKAKGDNYVTAINMSSMLLLSRGVHDHYFEFNLVRFRCGNRIDFHELFWHEHHRLSSHETSCLYTGDVGLKEKKYQDILTNIKHNIFPNGVGLLQIPHHGSVKNYDFGIIRKMQPLSAFVWADLESENPQYFAQIDVDFEQEDIPLFKVLKAGKTRLTIAYYIY